MYLSFAISTRDLSRLEGKYLPQGWKDNLFQHSTHGKSCAPLCDARVAGFSSIFVSLRSRKQPTHPLWKNDFPLPTRWGSGLVRSKGMETNANLFSSCIYLSNVQKRSVTRHEILIGSCSGKSLLIMAFRHNP